MQDDKKDNVNIEINKLKAEFNAEVQKATDNIEKINKMLGNGTGEMVYLAITGGNRSAKGAG